jgi:hypothetical protein
MNSPKSRIRVTKCNGHCCANYFTFFSVTSLVIITYKYNLPLEISWEEFVEHNSEKLSGEQLERIKFKLLADGVYHGGENAADPNYVLTASKEEMGKLFEFPAHILPPPDSRPGGNAPSP